MITIGDREFRNLEEQVRRNQDDIKYILEEEGVLNQFGIKVVGQVDTQGELPSASTYQGDYGDAYAIGTQPPYELYIYTREFSGETGPQWFSIGKFPVPSTVPGPTGSMGPTGPQGTRGSKWESGPTVPSSIIGYNLGDQYLATSAGDVYEVRSGGWVNTGNIRGPQGIQGIQGKTGPTGPRGNTGPMGPQGPVGPAFTIMGVLANENLLPDPATVPDNYAYIVGNDTDGYDLYVQVVGENEWVNAGKVESVVGPTGPQGAKGNTGDVGLTALEYSQIQSFSVEPETEDTFIIQTSYCNRTPVVGDKFLCNIHGYATVAGRSWIAGCTVYRDGSTLKGQIKSLTETTGAAGPTGAVGPTGPAGADGSGLIKRYLHTIRVNLLNGTNMFLGSFSFFSTNSNAVSSVSELLEEMTVTPLCACGYYHSATTNNLVYNVARDGTGLTLSTINSDGFGTTISFRSPTGSVVDFVRDLGAS